VHSVDKKKKNPSISLNGKKGRGKKEKNGPALQKKGRKVLALNRNLRTVRKRKPGGFRTSRGEIKNSQTCVRLGKNRGGVSPPGN